MRNFHEISWSCYWIVYFSKANFLYFLWYLDIFGPMMIKRSIIGSFARKCILTDHRECRQTLAPPDHHLYVLFDDDWRAFSNDFDYFRVTSPSLIMKEVGSFKTYEWKLYFPTIGWLCEFGETNLDYFPFWTYLTARSSFRTPSQSLVWCYHPRWSTAQEPVRSVLPLMLMRVPIFKSNTYLYNSYSININTFVLSFGKELVV